MDDGALSAVRVDAAACLPHATVQDYCCVELGPSTLTRMQAGAHATNAADRHGRTDRDVHPDPPAGACTYYIHFTGQWLGPVE